MHVQGLCHGCRLSTCGRAWAARAFCQSPSTVSSVHCRHSPPANRPTRCAYLPAFCASPGHRGHIQMIIFDCPTLGRQRSRLDHHRLSVLPLWWPALTTLQKYWQRSMRTNRNWTRRQGSGRLLLKRMMCTFCRLWCGTGLTNWR